MAIPSFTNPLPIPADLKAPYPQTPWRISPNLFGRLSGQATQDSYKKQEITSQDPEYPFISHYFNHQKPTNRSIAKAYCIHNPSEATVLRNKAPLPRNRSPKHLLPTPVEHRTPPPAPDKKPWTAFKPLPPPLPPFKSSSTNTAPKPSPISKSSPCGMEALPPNATPSAAQVSPTLENTALPQEGLHRQYRYRLFWKRYLLHHQRPEYATDTYSDGENLLLGWVSLRKPFPVISDTSDPRECSDMKRLKGQGAYHKYNAHYVPVIPDPQNPNSPNYYPCSVTHQPTWDEIVVFQQSQTLVRFWIVLQVDLTHPVPGTHHTIGELLQIISSALDQPPIQAHSPLVQFLEAERTQLLTIPSAQPLTTPDLTLLNIITQLFDDQKNLRSRMVTKLLSPAAPPTPDRKTSAD